MRVQQLFATTLPVLVAVSTTPVAAAEGDAAKTADLGHTNPLTNVAENALSSFTGWHAVLHLAALATTPVIITTGTDTAVHNTLARNQRLEPSSLPGVLGGYVLPFVAAGGLVGYGLLDDSAAELAAGSAVLQAVAIAFVYQSLLKAITGRPPPEAVVYENDDASRRFRFGFLRGGIHYGWPSGHMMTTTAVLFSLWRVYPDSWALRIGSGLLFAYVAGSVAIHERSSMHWFSDMTAGTLMGIAIGSSVGSGFAQHLGIETRASEGLSVTPALLPGQGIGLAIAGAL